MNAIAANPLIESYFASLENQLSDLPAAERQDVVLELRAHVLDRLAPLAKVSDEDCRTVLDALGAPREIARQYRLELMLNRASRSRSPLFLLRTTVRWALTGVQGFSVFIVGMIGYAMAAGFYIVALMKPIFPENVGMWVGDDVIFNIGYMVTPHGRDIAGHYFIPMTVAAGFLFTLVTTVLLRGLIGRFGKLKQKVAAQA